MLKTTVKSFALATAIMTSSAHADTVTINFTVAPEQLHTEADVKVALKTFERAARTACLFDNPIARKPQVDRDCLDEMVENAREVLAAQMSKRGVIVAKVSPPVLD